MALLLLSPLKRYRFINDLTKAPVTSDFFFPPLTVKFANFEPWPRERVHTSARANIEAKGAGSESDLKRRLAMQIGIPLGYSFLDPTYVLDLGTPFSRKRSIVSISRFLRRIIWNNWSEIRRYLNLFFPSFKIIKTDIIYYLSFSFR